MWYTIISGGNMIRATILPLESVSELELSDNPWPNIDNGIDLKKAINKLSKEDQFIIKHYFGLGGVTMTSQQELAELLGSYQAHISRAIQRILTTLKECLS